MAKNGLSSFLFATLNEETKAYGAVAKLAGAIDYKETININSYKHYEDDEIKWKDDSFKDGTIALTVGETENAIFAELLGRKTKEITINGGTKKVYVAATTDISIPVGFGFVEMFRSEKGITYGVKFYGKVIFEPFSTEGKTKAENNEYSNQAVTGTILTMDGEWSCYERYDTREEALEVLYALFGATPPSGNVPPPVGE